MIDVAVVGGGISGLAAAIKVRSAGYTVRVWEAQQKPGGNMRTEAHGPYLLERGPHSFLGSSMAMWRLLADASLLDTVLPATPAARYRYIYRDGRLHALPLGPGAFIGTRLLSGRAKARLLAEPFIRGAASRSDTVDSFFTRRFGGEAAKFLAGPFVSGIYAGDPSKLGAYDSFPKFWGLEAESGSLVRGAVRKVFARRPASDGIQKRRGLFSFPRGLGDLTGRLANKLGQDLTTGCDVTSVRRDFDGWKIETAEGGVTARTVIVATPPQETAAIVGGGIAALLAPIKLAAVAVVHLGCERGGDAVPAGFGCLIPRFYGIRTLGTVFVSQLFPGRAPEGGVLLTSFIGGALDPDALTLSDDALIATAVGDFQKVTGVSVRPDFFHVLRHARAIPQFEVGYRDRIAEVERECASTPGLFLAGNYLSGVGMNDAVESGYRAAAGAKELLESGR